MSSIIDNFTPTDILWARPSGKYYVAAGKNVNGRLIEDRNSPGKFRTFYPQRRKKKGSFIKKTDFVL